MKLIVKRYEVRFGETITECLNNGRDCRKIKKHVLNFKKNEHEKAKRFAEKMGLKVEVVYTFDW